MRSEVQERLYGQEMRPDFEGRVWVVKETKNRFKSKDFALRWAKFSLKKAIDGLFLARRSNREFRTGEIAATGRTKKGDCENDRKGWLVLQWSKVDELILLKNDKPSCLITSLAPSHAPCLMPWIYPMPTRLKIWLLKSKDQHRQAALPFRINSVPKMISQNLLVTPKPLSWLS